MIEAVENHMPEVIVIDEIGTELEAQAARTIAERGVQLIGTAHGNNLDNLMLNPTLSDLIGGIQSVTLGDEEARRRRSQKSVLERKQPPTFDVIVEIQDRERVLVHSDVAQTVDAMLLGDVVTPELRWRDEEGVHRSQSRPRPSAREGGVAGAGDRFSGLTGAGAGAWGREPGWRGASHVPHGRVRRRGPAAGATGVPAGADRRLAGRPSSGSDRGSDRGARSPEGDRPAPLGVMPGERFAARPGRPVRRGRHRGPRTAGAGRGRRAPLPPRSAPGTPASWRARRHGGRRRPGPSTRSTRTRARARSTPPRSRPPRRSGSP